MNPVKTATLMGHVWKIKFCSVPGDKWGTFDWGDMTLCISYQTKERLRLDTIIHECLHAFCPYLHEDFVATIATDLCNVLWRLGYRLPEDDVAKMSNVRTATLLGNRWRIKFRTKKHPLWLGECYENRSLIEIRDDIEDRLLLETILHECIHACCWYIDEEFVRIMAIDQSRLLWRLGYRPPEVKDGVER